MSDEQGDALRSLSLAVLYSSKGCQAARERSMITDQLVDESLRMNARHQVGIWNAEILSVFTQPA